MRGRRYFVSLLAVALAAAGCTLRLEAHDPGNAAPSATPPATDERTSPSPTVPPLPANRAETVYETNAQAGECAQPEARVAPPVEGTPLDDQVQTIARAVELLRGLRFDEPPESRLLAEDAFVAKAKALAGRGYSKAQAGRDQKILGYLGLIEPGTDLAKVSKDVAGEQIGGFYLPKEDTLYVPRSGEDLSPYDEIVVAHELEHALADSALGLPKLDGSNPRRSDARIAARALTEGDATLLMQHYGVAAFTPEEAAELLADPRLDQSIEDAEDVPFVLQRSLEFPYTEGAMFACRLFAEGGWEAIDRAYRRLPAATSQILLPRLYDDGVDPVAPPRVEEPGKTWTAEPAAAFGMFDLSLLLQAPGGEPAMEPEEALDRAREWTGGAMAAWVDGDDVAVAIAIATLRANGAEPALCGHMAEWVHDSFPDAEEVPGRAFRAPGRYAIVECTKTTVTLAMAPTKATAERLLP